MLWVVAEAIVGRYLVQFVRFVREKATENICCKHFRYFCSCFGLIAECLYTYRHRKCGLSFVCTRDDGTLEGPKRKMTQLLCMNHQKAP